MGITTRIMAGGVDVTQYCLEYNAQESTEVIIDTARLTFYAEVLDHAAFRTGDEITIERGPDSGTLEYIHRGYVKQRTGKDGKIDVDSPNKLWKLSQMEATITYDKDNSTQAGIISEIIRDLVVTKGGLNADTTTIPNSSSYQGNPLRRYHCDHDNLLERINTLVAVLNWQLYYNPRDDKVYCEPPGNQAYGTQLQIGPRFAQGYILDMPAYEEDSSKIINVADIGGARKWTDNITESGTGDGNRREFLLSYIPEAIEVKLNDTTQRQGNYDQTAGTYDYILDREGRKVVFGTAPGAGATISMVYSSNVPVIVTVRDPASIQNYTDGEERKQSFVFNDLVSMTDAEERGQKILSEYSTPFVKYQANISQEAPMILPGMRVSIIDDFHKLDTTLVARSIIRSYPIFQDKVTFADRRMIKTDTMQAVVLRLEKLEKENLRNSTLVRSVFGSTRQLALQRRCTHFYRKHVGTTAVYGNPTAVYGAGIKYGRSGNPEVLVQVWQGDMTFREHFYDSLFWDALYTDWTMDTTLRQVT